MERSEQGPAAQMKCLERRLRRTQALAAGGAVMAAGLVLSGMTGGRAIPDEVRTRRLVVVDDRDVARVVIEQDRPEGDRRSRSAGIRVHDGTGAERGGLSTMDDGSVVFALDAPAGVGAPMRDRVGIVVHGDGSAYVSILDNQMRAVARMDSDAEGAGGLKLYRWDAAEGKIHIRLLTFAGEEVSEVPWRR